MQELLSYWKARSAAQKAVIIGAFLGAFLLIAGFATFAGREPKALLYSGLDPAQSSEVVAKIEQAGVGYEIRGEAIWVDASMRDRLRMDMAAENLPRMGGSGYELLDGMSGFGTTSQMFDAAYWRAKEGELARTILTLPNVMSARVHLTAPRSRGYRQEAPGAASVTLTTNGSPVTRQQAKSLRYLIASAVPGLTADHVTVIDSARGVVQSNEDGTVEDRTSELKRNVERILEAHVGMGNAIVEANLELVTETEQLTEQRFDPDQRALISQETQETTDQSTAEGQAPVTAASNLPDNQGQQGDRQQSQSAETRQRQNYEVSSVTREIRRQPGSVRRMTVAVLVNGVATTAADGTVTTQPRSDAELQGIQELVAAATGFSADRGDEITVKSLPFVSLADAGTSAARPTGLLDRLSLDNLLRLALMGLFLLVALFLILRPVMRARAAALPAPASSGSELALAPPAAEPEIMDGLPQLTMAQPSEYQDDVPMLPMADFDFSSGGADDNPVDRLKRLMRERQDESLRLIGGWIAKDAPRNKDGEAA